jgi:hypothetical protein
MSNRTKASAAHVGSVRKGSDRAATWFDVADAYDAGMRHGLGQPKNALKQLQDAGAVIHEGTARRIMYRSGVDYSE